MQREQVDGVAIIVLLIAILATTGCTMRHEPAAVPPAATKKYFQTRPHDNHRPFPTEMPVLRESESAEGFDWFRYVTEAKSAADKIFRVSLANEFTTNRNFGDSFSNSSEMFRYDCAAEELQAENQKIIAACREKLKSSPELLKDFEDWLAFEEKTLQKRHSFVMGSWTEGSGVRVAGALNRMEDQISLQKDLEVMMSSLDLQDLGL